MRRINPTAFHIARRGTSREVNRQIALNLIRAKQPISRAELARLMGLRRGAVSRLVDELLETRRVFEGVKAESKRGRRPTYLHLETRQRCVLAVDISASRSSIMVTDLLGQPLLDVVEFATRRQPRAQLAELVKRLAAVLAAHPEVGECVGMGVVVSGLVDLGGGRVRYSPTLGWRDFDLTAPLQAATKLPVVVVENSCKACVLAQVWAVRGDAPLDGPIAFVNVSDGVGVGIAIDGKLLRGANNIAGEFGHVPLDTNGPLCSCGQRGCWEAYCSKRSIIARYLGQDPSWPGSGLLNGVTVGQIIERARAREPKALQVIHETGHSLGRGFATIVKTIDPRRIYIGGEITASWDLIEGIVHASMRESRLMRDVPATEILTVGLGEHPRLRGAAALVNAPAFAAAELG